MARFGERLGERFGERFGEGLGERFGERLGERILLTDDIYFFSETLSADRDHRIASKTTVSTTMGRSRRRSDVLKEAWKRKSTHAAAPNKGREAAIA